MGPESGIKGAGVAHKLDVIKKVNKTPKIGIFKKTRFDIFILKLNLSNQKFALITFTNFTHNF